MYDINMQVHIKAEPETVWQMLTDPNQLMRWFPSRVENSLQVDGNFSYWFDKEDANKECVLVSGRYTLLEPFTKCVHTWEFDSEERSVRSTVEWNLVAEDGGTTVQLRHWGLADGEAGEREHKEHSEGWTWFLDNLRTLMHEQTDQRPASGMKVTVPA